MRPCDSVSLTGAGVHSGSASSLALILRKGPGLRGPRFRFPGLPDLGPGDLAALPRRAQRATVLGEAGQMRTPEHLLAALLFFRDEPLDITCDAPEPPGLDGSALPFREAMAALAPARAAAPAWREYPCDLRWEHGWEYGYIRVRPAPFFRVCFELDRPPLRETYALEGPAAAWREILPARTFAFHREWREAMDSADGLMAGAGIDSGLLLAESEGEHRELGTAHPEWAAGPFPILNQREWRVAAEPAKHKILDLLGDLALLGLSLPALDIEIRNGGHPINHLLLEKLTHGRAS